MSALTGRTLTMLTMAVAVANASALAADGESNVNTTAPRRIVVSIPDRKLALIESDRCIRGTDQPSTIGKAKSHGCVRLKNADIEKLFERVRGGDVVEIYADRTTETATLFPST